jgi:hypothetical protein
MASRKRFALEPDVSTPAGGRLRALVGTPSHGDVPIYNAVNGRFEPGPVGGSVALDDLSDVDLTGLADGDVLTYDSGSGLWVPAPGGGSLALDDLTDVAAASPNDGDVLAYDSGTGDWVPVAPGSAPVEAESDYMQGVEWFADGGVVNNGVPTPSGSGVTTAGNDADGHALTFNISGAAGSSTNRRSAAVFTRQGESAYYARIKTGPDITSCAYFFGLSSTIHTGTSSTPTGHCALLRYHTTDDGTAFWRCITRDGTTTTTTTTTAAIAASTLYKLKVETDGSECRFYVDGVLVATHTTNLPGSTTSMLLLCDLIVLAAVSRTFKVYHYGYRCLS